MPVTQKFSCKHPNGDDLFLFTLTNAHGTEIVITNYGAIIMSFNIKMKDGMMNDIVLGFDNIEDYWSVDYLKNYPWFGCAIGRYCNRIKNGVIQIKDQKYQLTKNKGQHTLHGGAEGFDKKVWEVISMDNNPLPCLELKYISPDGDEGFPGTLETSLRFTLNDHNELSYEFSATTDKPTAINLTRHEYFNLDTSKNIINEHEIKINAPYVLEQDENLVVAGGEQPVGGTAFDLRKFSNVGKQLQTISEYDKSFVTGAKKDLPVAEVRSLQSGMLLQVFSTEPVVHFYTGKWIPSVKGKKGIQYGSFSGFCLETHKHPNAVNIQHFPDTILKPGEKYYQKTVYKIIIEDQV